jgi:hypothetical protein
MGRVAVASTPGAADSGPDYLPVQLVELLLGRLAQHVSHVDVECEGDAAKRGGIRIERLFSGLALVPLVRTHRDAQLVGHIFLPQVLGEARFLDAAPHDGEVELVGHPAIIAASSRCGNDTMLSCYRPPWRPARYGGRPAELVARPPLRRTPPASRSAVSAGGQVRSSDPIRGGRLPGRHCSLPSCPAATFRLIEGADLAGARLAHDIADIFAESNGDAPQCEGVWVEALVGSFALVPLIRADRDSELLGHILLPQIHGETSLPDSSPHDGEVEIFRHRLIIATNRGRLNDTMLSCYAYFQPVRCVMT